MAGAATVAMFDPESGKVVQVSPSRVEQMQALGLSVDSPDSAERRQYEQTAGAGELAKSVGEGLASGATLGLSDAALAELGGDDYRHQRHLRDETFEGPHKLAEGVGMVAPLLVPGAGEAEAAEEGLGLAARGASALPSSLVARAAGGVGEAVTGGLARLGAQGVERGIARDILERAAGEGAAGLVEGGLAGAGQGISEDELAEQHGGYDQLAESAWAGAKSGAMFGLFGGAAIGGLSGAAGGAARGLFKRFGASGDELAEAANERAVKATGARGSDLRRLGSEEKIQQVGKDIREYTLKDGRPLLEQFDNAESLAPKLEQARAEQGAELGSYRQRVAETEPKPPEIEPGVKGYTDHVEASLKPQEPAPPGTYPDAARFLERVKTEVTDPLRRSDSLATRKLANQVEEQFAGISEAVEKGEPVGFNRLLDARKDIQSRVYGLEKQMRGPNPPPAPELAHLRSAERLLDDALDSHMATKLQPEDFARYKEAKRLYSSFAPADQLAEKATAQNLGNRFLSSTDYAAGLSTGAGLLAGGHPVAALGGLAVSALHKQVRERGSAFLATLATRAERVDGGIDAALTKYFRKVGDRSREPRLAAQGVVTSAPAAFDVHKALFARNDESTHDAYDRIVARAQSFANGGHVQEYALDEVAPRTAHAMRQVQMRAAQHLLQNAPVPPRKTENPNLGELNNQIRPDPVQLYDFAQRVRAIDKPETVLQDLQNGRLSLPAVEAVKAVYPLKFAAMQAMVIEKLGEQSKPVAYEERIKLGLMFDLPTDSTLRPENLAATQAVYAQKNPPVKAQPPPPANASRRFESTTERLETGDIPQ